jgi:hypothetical protein
MVNSSGFRSALAILCIFSAIADLTANDSAYKFEGKGNTVVPVQNDQIEMVAETIWMKLDHKAGRWFVDCEFTFKNSGPATTVLMGFPDTRANTIWLYPGDPGHDAGLPVSSKLPHEWSLKDFKVQVDGSPVPAKHVETHPDAELILEGEDAAYVWEVPFEEGETKII